MVKEEISCTARGSRVAKHGVRIFGSCMSGVEVLRDEDLMAVFMCGDSCMLGR